MSLRAGGITCDPYRHRDSLIFLFRILAGLRTTALSVRILTRIEIVRAFGDVLHRQFVRGFGKNFVAERTPQDVGIFVLLMTIFAFDNKHLTPLYWDDCVKI